MAPNFPGNARNEGEGGDLFGDQPRTREEELQQALCSALCLQGRMLRDLSDERERVEELRSYVMQLVQEVARLERRLGVPRGNHLPPNWARSGARQHRSYEGRMRDLGVLPNKS